MSELKWAQPLLGDVATVVDPHPSHRAPPEVDGGVPFVGIGDLTERGEVLASSARKVSPKVLDEHKTRYSVARGDIAYGRVATVGKVMRFGEINEPFALSPTMALIQPHGVAASYLAHFLQSKQWDDESAKLLTGTTRSSLGIQLLRKIRISCPRTFEEQIAIGSVLDTLDTAIHETEAIIAKLKAVKQGLLHDLLTRGIDANGELRPPQAEAPHFYKESPLGWIPKEWDVKPLGGIAEVSRGKFTHRPRNDPRFYGGKHPFIQTGDVAAAEGEFVSTYSQTLSDRGISVSQEFPVGTIAITIAANIADTAILGIPMYFPDSVVGAIVDKAYNVRFIELSIRKAKRILDARAPQSAQKNINLQDLRPLLLAVPEKPEQDAIAIRYETLQNRLQSETDALAKFRFEKSGLMDDLLTGRVRVTSLLAEAAQQPGSA